MPGFVIRIYLKESADWKFLGRHIGLRSRGRRKSRRPVPWSWDLFYWINDAWEFRSVHEAIKQVRRCRRRFRPAFGEFVIEVWSLQDQIPVLFRKIWPPDDIVGLIGMLEFDEEDIGSPTAG